MPDASVVEREQRTPLSRSLRLIFICLILLIVFGLVAPFISAARFTAQIRSALERTLGRSVQIGKIHFTLFSGPGFYLDEVSIGDDPRYGLEPCAYVPELDARLRLDKLLFGRIEIASIRLVEPSLNLVKGSDGTWNFVSLLQRVSTPRRAPLSLLPAVEVKDARIDFKFGTRKTTLYLTQADLTIYPERLGKLEIQFAGSPARTDRSGSGFGHVRGKASWFARHGETQTDRLVADFTLDPSNLSELTTLVEGYDLGVHGRASTRAHVEGPIDALQVNGELFLDDLHRWDLLPQGSNEWHVGYSGRIDGVRQTLDLATRSTSSKQAALGFQVRVTQLLTRPIWAIVGQMNNAPAAGLAPLAMRMGVALPPGLKIDGRLNGAVGYASRNGIAGSVVMSEVVATMPDLPAFQAAEIRSEITPERIVFSPVTVTSEAMPGELRAGGSYSIATREVRASLNFQDLPIGSITQSLKSWSRDGEEGSASIEPSVFSVLTSGTGTGQLNYARQADGEPSWSGRMTVRDASIDVPGVSEPLHQLSVRMNFDGASLDVPHFSGMVANLAVRGDYHYFPGVRQRERLHLELPVADIGQLENSLGTTLRPHNWLARLRVGKRTFPAWLLQRNLDADISIGQLTMEGQKVGMLTARMLWEGTTVQCNSVRLKSVIGDVAARGTIDLASAVPRYRFRGDLLRFPWKGGVVNATGTLDSSGLTTEVVENLKASGTFVGENLRITPEAAFESLRGKFALKIAAGWPDLKLTDVLANEGSEAWTGEAQSQQDGSLIFDLSNDERQLRVVSSIDPQVPSAPAVSQPSNDAPGREPSAAVQR